MISPWRTGAAFGAAVGLFHLVWAALVAAGVAQPVIDFILRLHFVQVPVQIAPFNLGTAVTLVALTATLSALGGAVFAGLWNWLHQGPARVAGPRAAAN